MTPDARIIALINGFQVSRAISVVATLGIADLLRDGARDCQALAAAAHVLTVIVSLTSRAGGGGDFS